MNVEGINYLANKVLQYIQTLWYTVYMDAVLYSREANLNNYTAQFSPS
jgi:hypothetical protein